MVFPHVVYCVMELKLTVFKDGAYKFKAIFVWFTEYAGKADLNKCMGGNHAFFEDN